jgi:hypothetical protein
MRQCARCQEINNLLPKTHAFYLDFLCDHDDIAHSKFQVPRISWIDPLRLRRKGETAEAVLAAKQAKSDFGHGPHRHRLKSRACGEDEARNVAMTFVTVVACPR